MRSKLYPGGLDSESLLNTRKNDTPRTRITRIAQALLRIAVNLTGSASLFWNIGVKISQIDISSKLFSGSGAGTSDVMGV